jgi:hypothetical protein
MNPLTVIFTRQLRELFRLEFVEIETDKRLAGFFADFANGARLRNLEMNEGYCVHSRCDYLLVLGRHTSTAAHLIKLRRTKTMADDRQDQRNQQSGSQTGQGQQDQSRKQDEQGRGNQTGQQPQKKDPQSNEQNRGNEQTGTR